jgi:hypothetical protein
VIELRANGWLRLCVRRQQAPEEEGEQREAAPE